MRVSVIGAGLAGCEAAWTLANNGVEVTLYEMKPHKYSPAHHSGTFAELVCSNSLKASRIESAAGLLKAEMRLLGSLILDSADQTSVAAGGALAVDRNAFSELVTERIKAHKNITVVHSEVTEIPDGYVIIATGPLTSDAFAERLRTACCGETLSFFDAAAPIVTFDSLDQAKVFFAARYGRGDDDYINCPFDKEQYERFHEELIHAETAELKAFDKQSFRVYEGCMPIEVMAKRGSDTIRFGPLKPVGLADPHTGKRPYAVVQLRRENAAGTLYNLVGFQTNLKFPEQKRVFSMIPGLENAEFSRYGVMHRNTFLNSPQLLDKTFALMKDNRIYFAGQMTGVEGYIESTMSGLIAGVQLVRKLRGEIPLVFPADTMCGALCGHISDETSGNFQPMGCNMGILPPLLTRVKDKQERYRLVAERALKSFQNMLDEQASPVE